MSDPKEYKKSKKKNNWKNDTEMYQEVINALINHIDYREIFINSLEKKNDKETKIEATKKLNNINLPIVNLKGIGIDRKITLPDFLKHDDTENNIDDILKVLNEINNELEQITNLIYSIEKMDKNLYNEEQLSLIDDIISSIKKNIQDKLKKYVV